jgi:hypothetical protein
MSADFDPMLMILNNRHAVEGSFLHILGYLKLQCASD